MDEKKEFDEFADNYREIHTKNVIGISGKDSNYFTEYKIKELKRAGILPDKPAILDLGCGDGNSCRYFLQNCSGAEYYGLDVSPESIKQAQQAHSGEHAHFSIYDGKKIPFEDESFDLVFIACVMHHIAPNARVPLLRECRRVLKKGGRMVIFEHNPLNPVTLKVVNDCPFDKDAILMTAGKLERDIKNSGFEKTWVKYTIFFPRKRPFDIFLKMEPSLSFIPIGGQYYVIAIKI